MSDDVHYSMRPIGKKHDAADVTTACSSTWSTPPKRTLVVRHVTCSDCLDWIAKNHRTVVKRTSELRDS